MNHHQAFLSAVLESPDDDAPRLIYADWLTDHGQADRGEFIRLQCERARLPENDPHQVGRLAREQELLEQYAQVWAEPLRATTVKEWAFERGFIEAVCMLLEVEACDIVSLMQTAPIRLIKDYEDLAYLGGLVEALPHLDRLTGLECWALDAVADETMLVLLTSPHLRNLRTLILHHDIASGMIDDAILSEGVTSPHRIHLAELAVNLDSRRRGPSNPVIRAMAGSPYLRNVSRLTLTHTAMDRKSVEALAGSPYLTNLSELDLGFCRMSAAAWRVIREGRNFQQLRWLRVHRALSDDEFLINDEEQVAAFHERFGTALVDWHTEASFSKQRNPSWHTWD